MSAPNHSFCYEQAQACARAAAAADLPNLRDKYLRAEAAWQVLADKEARTREARILREAESAQRVLDAALQEAIDP